MTTQWSLTAPTMVLSTQGFSGTEIPQGTPETFVYVNSTLEILSTFVHVFIQQSLESFPCVCVWRSVFTLWAVWWVLECDERQDRKDLEISHSPRVRGRQKRSLNSPRTIAKTPVQRLLSCRPCTWGLAPAGGSTWELNSEADPRPLWTS